MVASPSMALFLCALAPALGDLSVVFVALIMIVGNILGVMQF